MRDLQDAHKYAITNFARELLEVADNLSRALEAVPARARDDIEFVKNLADGIAMTEKALLTSFERHQIEKVTPAIGESSTTTGTRRCSRSSTDQPPGTVVQVLQPGYTIAERLLRPALVAVAKAPPARLRSRRRGAARRRAGAGLRPGRASGSTPPPKPRAAELASGCAPAARGPHASARSEMTESIGKVVLAYSGGLDTSVILRWLQDRYRCEVVTFTADLGQGEVEPARAKAELMGATQIFVEDLREEFVRDYVFPMFRANALYEGAYLLGTSIARPLIAKRLVEIAHEVGADAVAHGATGKGNDQVRFELSAYALDPRIKVIAPGANGISTRAAS